MRNTRLILLEGLCGTGKSTNSCFLRRQLEGNRISTRWVHEMERPHPTSSFYEASLTYDEYELYAKKFPDAQELLDKLMIKRKKTVSIDLLELNWNHSKEISDEALEELKKYDTWAFSLEKYKEFALEKWEDFVEDSLRDGDKVNIVDSSIFQYQIFSFLLKNDPYENLEDYVKQLFRIISPLSPTLIYLYRNRTEDSIDFVERERGTEYFQCIWERDRNEPYYAGRPNGAEGHRQFLRDYGIWANKLFHSATCDKRSIEISAGQWMQYEQDVLNFLDIKRVTEPQVKPIEGTFKNNITMSELRVDGFNLIDPWGKKRMLFPKSENEFFIQRLSTVLKFIDSDRIMLTDGQVDDRWTTSGMIYDKV